MNFQVLSLVCCLSAALAYPHADAYIPDYEHLDLQEQSDVEAPKELQRFRRQLVGGGGGSLRDGIGISLDGRAPVWKSDNGRHQFDITGGYSQHLGGPYGSSRPNFRAGGVYTYRF